MSASETSSSSPRTIEEMEKSNKASIDRFCRESDKLKALLSSRSLTLDDLGLLLMNLGGKSAQASGQIITNIKETFAFVDIAREQGDASLGDAPNIAPRRFRRLNRV